MLNSTSFINTISFDKKENILLKKLSRCKTRKCSKINKEHIKEGKIFEKIQAKKCPQKSAKEFMNCASELYDNSKFKILYDKFVKCSMKKCSKESKTLKKYQKKLQNMSS